MGTPCPTAPPKSFGKNRRLLRCTNAVARAARRLWPAKTAAHLAARTGAAQRSAENWLAGASAPSAEHLAQLLRSDAGLEILSELMDGAETRWWRAVQVRVRLAELERRSAETRQMLEELRENERGLLAAGGLASVRGSG